MTRSVLKACAAGLALIGATLATSALAAEVNASAAAMVPKEIHDKGVLRVGTNMPYAPMEFFQDDGKTPTGLDVDLVNEIAQRLGLKAEWVNINWDGLIPALIAGRFELVAASVLDFEERRQQADFVDYMTTGVSVVVSRADQANYQTNMDLCGKRVGASKGTEAARIGTELVKKCDAAGKSGTVASSFADDNTGLLAVRSKRIDAYGMDSISAVYEASTEQGKTVYRNVLPNFSPTKGLYGFVVAKRNRPLTDAAALVLTDMMKDGTYKSLLDKYGVGQESIPAVTISAGGKQGATE